MDKLSYRQETFLTLWGPVLEGWHPLHIRYPKGELIYQAGGYAAGAYLISGGVVSEIIPDQKRRKCPPVEILGPGDILGVEIFLGNGEEIHLCRTRAITDTEVFFFERTEFLSLLEGEDDLYHYCLHCLSDRFFKAREWEYIHCSSSIAERVCRTILDLAEKGGETQDNGRVIIPPEITQTTLSRLLGISGSNVNRAMSSLPRLSSSERGIEVFPEELRLWLTDKVNPS
jgi:CRP-like cAMP-binding protein